MTSNAHQTNAPIVQMYRVGMEIIPGIAESVSSASQYLHSVIPLLDVQAALAGDPKGMRETLALCDDLHEALRRMTETLNHCAGAVIATAEDFRRTDEDAARDYQQMDKRLKNGEPPAAVEVTPIDNSDAPGATEVTYDHEHGSPQQHEHHVETTPAPEEVPTAEEEQEEHDDRLEQPPTVEAR
jgi:hypothetical protein